MSLQSPVAAGVDGSNSASGVVNVLAEPEVLQQRLDPSTSSRWFSVVLDGRAMRTPLGQTLAVPSILLAWAIASEWDSQEDIIRPTQMPLMSLACTALDQTAANPELVAEQVLQYLHTDTVCYWADPSEDRVLHRLQRKYWGPIHEHCELLLGCKPALALGVREGLLMSRARAGKPSGLPHSSQILDGATSFVKGLDSWQLTALQSVTAASKSFLIGASVVSNGIPSESALKASRVEEEFQIENWGLVEGGHDYDRLNSSVQIRSAQILVSTMSLDFTFH